MACDLPSSYVAARTWNPEFNSATASNARVWAPLPDTTSCDALPKESDLFTFNGLTIYTFAGERISLIS